MVALLGFGYRLALHVYQRGLTGFLGQVTRFVADFMLHHCIARWIAQRGGWVGAQALATSSLLLGHLSLPALPQPWSAYIFCQPHCDHSVSPGRWQP